MVKLGEMADTELGVAAVPLSDGRVLTEARAAGSSRIVIVSPGKEPAPFAPTLDDETFGPIARLGSAHVVFRAGTEGNRQVVAASIADGLLVRRLSRVNGNDVTAMAGSPDGKTLFYVVAGVVWSIPAEDGEPRQVRRGDFVAVDPRGQYLVVQVNETDTVRMFRAPLPQGPEVEIPIRSDFRVAPDSSLGPDAIGPDGRILVRAVSRESWFWPPAILDQKTGTLTPVLKDWNADYTLPGWTADGDIIGVVWSARSRLWRFRPVR